MFTKKKSNKKNFLLPKYYKLRSRGFTLIELIVVLLLFVTVSFFLSYLTVYQYWIYNTETAELNITNDARMALDQIDDQVRQSNRVLSSYSGYTTGSQTLILQIQSINSSNQLIAGTHDNVVVYLSGSDLFLQIFPNISSSRLTATKKLASNVNISDFAFTYDNADYALIKQVSTNVTIEQKVGNQTRSINLSSQSKLRNY